MKNSKEFLSRVWGRQRGWAFLAYGKGGSFKQKAYLYPEQLDLMVSDATRQNNWANVYFCPHLFTSGRDRKKTYAAPLSALWIDKDKGPVEDLKPTPTICWRTSEGRHQAIWLLKEPIDPETGEEINKQLTYKCRGDKGGWYLGKVIRFPCSMNHKYNPPFEGFLLWGNGPTYYANQLQIQDGLSPEEEQSLDLSSPVDPKTMPDEIPNVSQVLLEKGRYFPAVAWDLLNQTPLKDQDWSDNLWRLERLLFEAGLNEQEVFAVAAASPWNKYKRDNRPPAHLWEDVIKASLEQGPLQDIPAEEALPWATMDKLLLYYEKPQWLVEGIWMKSNVGFIAGVGKSYKSVLSLDLALSVASGTPFLGKYPVLDAGPVLMVQEEDPLWRVAHRMQTMAIGKGLASMRMFDNPDGLSIQVRRQKDFPLYVSVSGGFSFSDDKKVEALERSIDQYRPRLVILDPYFMLSAGIDEFKSSEAVLPLTIMKGWRDRYGCAIAVVHHYNKGGENNEFNNKLYGSMALYSWHENSLFIKRERGSNVVSIDRDIKDAETLETITVEMVDIDEEYKFQILAEMEMGGLPDKIELVMSHVSRGSYLTVKEIMSSTELSQKTVLTRIRELESEGKVIIKTGGQGGALRVYPGVGLSGKGLNLSLGGAKK